MHLAHRLPGLQVYALKYVPGVHIPDENEFYFVEVE